MNEEERTVAALDAALYALRLLGALLRMEPELEPELEAEPESEVGESAVTIVMVEESTTSAAS